MGVWIEYHRSYVGWREDLGAAVKSDKPYLLNSVVALTPHSAIACGFPYGRDGAGVVLKTVDDGTTWTVSNPGIDGAKYASLAFRSDHVTGIPDVNARWLLRTTDAGATWTKVTIPGTTPIIFIAEHGNVSLPDDKTIVIGYSHRDMLISGDDGRTWTCERCLRAR